jgi:PAS domain S-box-containing protein
MQMPILFGTLLYIFKLFFCNLEAGGCKGMIVSFGKKIVLGFALSISVFAAIAFASYMSDKHYAASSRSIEHAHQIIESAETVLSDLKDGETSVRGYVITFIEDFLEPYNRACSVITSDMQRLRMLVADRPQEKKKADSLLALADAKMKRLAFSITLRKAQPVDSSYLRASSGIGKEVMDRARQVTNEIKNTELLYLSAEEQNLKNYASLNALLNSIGVLGALSLFIALYLLLRTEIDRRNKAEAELRKSNSFLATILENIPNMIFVKDAASLRFVRFNKAGEDLTGIGKQEIIGKSDHDFFPKQQADLFTLIDREVLSGNRQKDIVEEPIQTRYKGERWLQTAKIPLFDENGKPQFLLGISKDITESKKQQYDIKQLNLELEAFSYSVSHDLRGPLNSMNSISTLLEEQYASGMDPEGIRLLGMLRTSSRSLSDLIQDLLSFARVGRQEISKQEVDMKALVSQALEDAKILIPGCKPEFRLAELPNAHADKTMLKLVLVNLLSNLLKFSCNKEKPLIEAGFRLIDGETTYFIKDNGAGFDMKYSDKLFSVFQRLHQQTEFEGTGVGLAIVHRIITKHGGKVWAEGKTGEGATLYFTLPS